MEYTLFTMQYKEVAYDCVFYIIINLWSLWHGYNILFFVTGILIYILHYIVVVTNIEPQKMVQNGIKTLAECKELFLFCRYKQRTGY